MTKLLFDAVSPPLEHALLDVMGHKLSKIHSSRTDSHVVRERETAGCIGGMKSR